MRDAFTQHRQDIGATVARMSAGFPAGFVQRGRSLLRRVTAKIAFWSCQEKFSPEMQGFIVLPSCSRSGRNMPVPKFLSIHQRGQTAVDRADTAQVIVVNVAKNDAFYLVTAQFCSVDVVQFFLLERSKKLSMRALS